MAVRTNVEIVSRKLGRAMSRGVAKLTLDITANLIEDTPVDTGWARANWVPSIGRPTRGVEGSRENVTRSRQEAGQARVLGFDIRRTGIVYVTNNVPYIEALNDGSSSQAPAGFVETDIDRAAAGLRGRNLEDV